MHHNGEGPRSLQLETSPQPSTAKNETKLKKKQTTRQTHMESVLFIRKLLSGDLHPSPTQSGRLLCSPGPGTERGACRPADSPLSSKTKFVSHTLFTAAIPEGICSQNINWLNYETVYQPFTLRAAPMRATQSELGSGPRAGRRNGQGGEPGCVQRRPSHTEASVLLHRVFS